MIITVMTVGYGDIRPDETFSRIVIGCFIISMIIYLSKETSELTELMSIDSKYAISYKGKNKKHIVLLGNLTPNTLTKFLREFYHPDHNITETIRVVII